MNMAESNGVNGRLRNFFGSISASIVTIVLVASVSYMIASRVSGAVIDQQIIFLKEELKRQERKIEILETQLNVHSNLDGHTGVSARINDLRNRVDRIDDRSK